MYKILETTLPANGNEITITDAMINADTVFDVYADGGVPYFDNITVTDTSALIHFEDKAATDTAIKIVLNNIDGLFDATELSYEVPDTTIVNQDEFNAQISEEVGNVNGELQDINENLVELSTDIGDLEQLVTPNKDNIVNAINDAYNHGGGGSPHTYVSAETEVGVWIDNKKLYRRVITKTSAGTSGEFTLYTFTSNINLKFCYGNIGGWFPFPSYYRSGYTPGLFLDAGKTLKATVGSNLSNAPIELIVYYTK